jgi:hypothetical protein
MKILIDRNIERNAITHKTVMVSKQISWGGRVVEIPVAQRMPFPPRDKEKFRIEQLPYLAAACIAAKEKKLIFHRSFELNMERVRQKGPDDGYLGFDLLRGVEVKPVGSPAARTIIVDPSRGHNGFTEDEQMAFFRGIAEPRFLRIRKLVGEAHIDDAFHLWTAEGGKLDAFLTMDQTFWRVVNQKAHLIRSSVAVLTPKELCEKFDLQPRHLDELADACNPFA